jgi:hypothetical protein
VKLTIGERPPVRKLRDRGIGLGFPVICGFVKQRAKVGSELSGFAVCGRNHEHRCLGLQKKLKKDDGVESAFRAENIRAIIS